MKLHIDTGIFSFSQNLKFLERSDHECLHTISDKKIKKTITYLDKLVLIEISEGVGGMSVSAFVETTDFTGLEEYIKKFINEWFDLKFNIDEFYQFSATDEILSKMVENYYGLRLIGIPDFYESLVWSITGQQINLNFAYILKRKFVENFGKYLKYDGEKYYVFPKFDDLKGIRADDLLSMQYSRNKAEYIVSVTRLIADGTLDADKISKLDYHEAKKTLLNIKGIGNWTADYVLMKYFRFPEALPIGDAGLNAALKKFLGYEKKLSANEMQQKTQHWGKHSAYATFYLWRSLYV